MCRLGAVCLAALAGLLAGSAAAADEASRACVPSEQRARIEAVIAEYERRVPPATAEAASPPQLYSFYPQAGTLFQDLFMTNYVDLDPSSGIRDWDCTDITYNGHGGLDSGMPSFKRQAIGVPIFAALEGTVVEAHDGEPDMNTALTGAPANYVILDHGGTHYTWYFHFKKGSVAVIVGQQVVAGTQLGLMGSSGNSTGPHLHFETRYAGAVFEPYAGACRAGSSGWVGQIPVRRDTYAKEFLFSTSPFTGNGAVPFDEAPRVGTFVQGQRTVYFRLELGVMPGNSTWRVRFTRPDSSVAVDQTGSFGLPNPSRDTWWWQTWFLNLDVTGTWRLLYDVNGQTVADAPFSVVASQSQVVNRPPSAVSLLLDPPDPTANDVLFCRVQTSLVTEDPDYDLVRYRFEWKVNGAVVRDVTSAALSDALPKGRVVTGDVVACTVTPSDDLLSGPSATVTAGNPTVAIDDRSAAEGSAMNAAFRVFLSKTSASTVTVQYATADGSAVSGSDYAATSGTLSFSPGRTQHSIFVPIVTDGAVEGSQTFFVNLSNPTNATLGTKAQGIGTIADPPVTAKAAMYRSYNKSTDYHFFTTDLNSKNFAVGTLGFQDESNPIPFYVWNVMQGGSVPLFRMYNPNLGRHFYTASMGSRDFIMSIGGLYEKEEGFVYPLSTSPVPSGATELFLLYNNNSGTHLFSADANQKSAILNLFPGVWVQHTSVGYVFTLP